MKKIIFLILAGMLIAGCQSKSSEQKSTEVEPFTGVVQEAPQAVEIIRDTALPKPVVETPAAVSVAPAVISAAPAEAAAGSDDVVVGGKWGFSVHNFQTNTVEYYTSNGILLGKKSL